MEKAKKIDRVLSHFLSVQRVENKKMLDCGCGSGHIACYFAERNDVSAADIVDQRDHVQRNGVRFALLESGQLPFEDASFDIVLLNHVIPYVPDQERLMRETRRVLKEDGVCYFALSNRNFPLEAHSKIPFIHYLPRPVFSAILKTIMRSDQPVYPLSYRDMLRLIHAAGFRAHEYTVDIIKNPGRYLELSLPFHKLFPAFLRLFSPTNIFLLVKG